MPVCYLYSNAVVRKVPNFSLHTLKLNFFIAFENCSSQAHNEKKSQKSLNLTLYIVELLKWDTEKNYEDFFDEQKLSFPIFASTEHSM